MDTATWARLDTPGEDHARLVHLPHGYRLEGTARFDEAGVSVSVMYSVEYGMDWSTRSAVVARSGQVRQIRRDDSGWWLDGIFVPGLEDLRDVDFGFTPATNVSHIRRMALAVGEARDLYVAWMDADFAGLTRLYQHYERIGDAAYAYEAPGYAATLVFAPSGFVADYPGLWRMTG